MAKGSVSVWISAVRPRTLGAAIAPVVIATAMAYDTGSAHALSAAACLLGAILIQIGTNFANDYFDFVKGTDTKDRVGPTRATAAGLVTPQTMRLAMIVAFALVFVPGAYILYRGGWPFLVIGLVSIACGVLYTGGPYPLGYLGLGDLFVLVFFGPVALGGTYYVQSITLDANVLIAGLAPGLFSVAILTVNNLRDREGDAKSGKKTLAVRFGTRFARAEYVAALITGTLVIPLYLVMTTRGHYAALASIAVLLPAIPTIRTVLQKDGSSLNAALGNTGKLLLAFSLLFSAGWVLT
ncbi:MAG: 1,4-dihydroxy-2-naphthoate polyprenyltransferase [Candidatus Hydrogenedentota bacterium]